MSTNFDIAGSVMAGRDLMAPLADAITRYRTRHNLEKEQDAASQAIFNTALESRDANGNPLVSEDEKQLFQTGDVNTRKGIAAGIALRVHQSWQEREAKMRWGADPREGIPQPLVLPDGSVIPGRFYVPGAHTVIENRPPGPERPPQPTAPALGQEVIPGFIWDGARLRPKQANVTKADDLSRSAELSRKSEIDSLDSQIAALHGEIAGGNVRPGPDWLPLITTYADQLAKLQARRDSLASSAGVGVPIETDSSTGIKFYRDGNGDRKPLPGQQLPSAQHSASPSPAATPLTVPQVGEVRRGFRFKGGDPGDRNNWERMPAPAAAASP